MNLSNRSSLGIFNRIKVNPGLMFVLILLVALIAFEMFNYSTTDYALNDLLGTLKFAGMPCPPSWRSRSAASISPGSRACSRPSWTRMSRERSGICLAPGCWRLP